MTILMANDAYKKTRQNIELNGEGLYYHGFECIEKSINNAIQKAEFSVYINTFNIFEKHKKLYENADAIDLFNSHLYTWKQAVLDKLTCLGYEVFIFYNNDFKIVWNKPS